MLRRSVICLLAAVVPAAITVYVDTLSPGPAWTPWMYAIDFGFVHACWFVLALVAARVVATVGPRRPRVDRRRLEVWLAARE